MNPAILVFIFIAVIGTFGAGWKAARTHYEKQLSDIHASHALALAEATATALSETVRLQKVADDAARKHAKRQADLVRDRDANRAGLIGLSDAADQALRAANDTHSTCISEANTLTVVLGKCAAEYVDVAGHADEWASEVITLREAWPK